MTVVAGANDVSFGPVEPEVRLLITRPFGTLKGLLLPPVGVSQVPLLEFPVPQQKSLVVKGHMSCPVSVAASRREKKERERLAGW